MMGLCEKKYKFNHNKSILEGLFLAFAQECRCRCELYQSAEDMRDEMNFYSNDEKYNFDNNNDTNSSNNQQLKEEQLSPEDYQASLKDSTLYQKTKRILKVPFNFLISKLIFIYSTKRNNNY